MAQVMRRSIVILKDMVVSMGQERHNGLQHFPAVTVLVPIFISHFGMLEGGMLHTCLHM